MQIKSLKDLNSLVPTDGDVIKVLGYNKPHDGGAMSLLYCDGSQVEQESPLVFKRDNGPGFYKIIDSVVKPEMFGAFPIGKLYGNGSGMISQHEGLQRWAKAICFCNVDGEMGFGYYPSDQLVEFFPHHQNIDMRGAILTPWGKDTGAIKLHPGVYTGRVKLSAQMQVASSGAAYWASEKKYSLLLDKEETKNETNIGIDLDGVSNSHLELSSLGYAINIKHHAKSRYCTGCNFNIVHCHSGRINILIANYDFKSLDTYGSWVNSNKYTVGMNITGYRIPKNISHYNRVLMFLGDKEYYSNNDIVFYGGDIENSKREGGAEMVDLYVESGQDIAVRDARSDHPGELTIVKIPKQNDVRRIPSDIFYESTRGGIIEDNAVRLDVVTKKRPNHLFTWDSGQLVNRLRISDDKKTAALEGLRIQFYADGSFGDHLKLKYEGAPWGHFTTIDDDGGLYWTLHYHPVIRVDLPDWRKDRSGYFEWYANSPDLYNTVLITPFDKSGKRIMYDDQPNTIFHNNYSAFTGKIWNDRFGLSGSSNNPFVFTVEDNVSYFYIGCAPKTKIYSFGIRAHGLPGVTVS